MFVGNSRLREGRGPVYYEHVGGLGAARNAVGNTCYSWLESAAPELLVGGVYGVVERVVYGPGLLCGRGTP